MSSCVCQRLPEGLSERVCVWDGVFVGVCMCVTISVCVCVCVCVIVIVFFVCAFKKGS